MVVGEHGNDGRQVRGGGPADSKITHGLDDIGRKP
jgi:hypothetical protein